METMMKNKQTKHFLHDKSDYEVELKATSEKKNDARKYCSFSPGIKTNLWQVNSSFMYRVNGEQVFSTQNVIFSDSDFFLPKPD